MPTEPVGDLEKGCGGDWPALRSARATTQAKVDEIRRALARFDTPQTSVIVTGSFGRGEVTGGSDFDWMLLVDGGSDPEHVTLLRGIFEALQKLKVKQPGPTQTFGELISS